MKHIRNQLKQATIEHRMRKTLSNLYSNVYPKPDGGEYKTKELIGRFIVFGGLIALLIYGCIHSYFEMFPKQKSYKNTTAYSCLAKLKPTQYL